jgi:hypothetical protein
MTSPASFQTPSRIIEYAMKDAGLLQEGDVPNSDQYAEHTNRLNDLINLWQTEGLKLWLQRDLGFTPVANQATYTFGLIGTPTVSMTKPLRVLQAYYQDNSSPAIRRPLSVLSRDEYTRLSQTTQTGAVNSFFVDKQQQQLAVSLWLVPDSTAAMGTVHMILQYQVTNFINLTETMEFPIEWFIALRWGLADEICTGQPESVQARCKQRADQFKKKLEDWDVEDASTMFAPDSRGITYRYGFK